MGAAGIHVPQIESAALAREAVRWSLFSPDGERGLQPFVRAASYRAGDTAAYLRMVNDQTAIVVHLEGRGALADLDEILRVDRLDVLFIGPYDLSQSLGIPGQVTDPRVRDAMAQIIGKATATGKCVGTYCDDVETALSMRAMGVRYLAVSVDAAFLLRAARETVSVFRQTR